MTEALSHIKGDGFSSKKWGALLESEKARRIEERMAHMPSLPTMSVVTWYEEGSPTKDVYPIDSSYLLKSFKPKDASVLCNIMDVMKKFQLNKEQKRAFCLIVNHSVTPGREQLLMYLGGMAGTGKSQVIKALAHFFEHQGEPHRFRLIAPTGAAAAVIGGTTYHSLLGINPASAENISANMISQVKSGLKGTDYILLDEVSMIGARDLFTISKHLCLATGRHDKPFGGLNIIVKSCSGLHLRSTSDTSDIPYSFTPILFRFLISSDPVIFLSPLLRFRSSLLILSVRPSLFPCD